MAILSTATSSTGWVGIDASTTSQGISYTDLGTYIQHRQVTTEQELEQVRRESRNLVMREVDPYFVSALIAQTKDQIHAVLYFKYVKSKFKLLERVKLEARLKKLEKAFDVSFGQGQTKLTAKIFEEALVYSKESAIYAKGIIHYIDRDDLHKHKHHIRNGHISDTSYENYTRIIPTKIAKKKKELEPFFDDFIIYHYYSETQEDVKKMKPDEKAAMRDPVLFGMIDGSSRLYYIDEWDDEYCDLSFAEMIDALDKIGTLKSDPNKSEEVVGKAFCKLKKK